MPYRTGREARYLSVSLNKIKKKVEEDEMPGANAERECRPGKIKPKLL